ncbi:MAG: carboxypeptidase regulatory-like domain-containing protein [Nannocystaceae bacterium]
MARAGVEPAGKGGARPLGAPVEGDGAAVSRLPWNRPPTSISGRVVDQAGKPIAGAQVCATLRADALPSALDRDPRCTKAGGDGKYVLTGLPPLKVAISAGAPSYQPGRYDGPGKFDEVDLRAGEAKQGIDIMLEAGGVLVRGVVKDLAGGVIEGASVRGYRGWGWDAQTSFGTSNERGEFELWVAPGELNVTAHAEGYAQGNKSGAAPGYTFEVLLTPESVLEGRVVRADDRKPVADAYVTLESWGWAEHGTYTDADGVFRLGGLEPGRYKPIARTAESYGQIAESVRLGLGQSVADIEIAVHPMAALRGHIVVAGEKATPCEHGSLSVRGKVSQQQRWEQVGPEGEIEVAALEPDTYTISVHCDGYVAQSSYPEVVIADASVEGQIWQVEQGLVLRGRVVDQEDRPIAHASIVARPVAAGAREQQTFGWGEKTDQDGRFEAKGLLAGQYELTAEHEDYVTPDTRPKITLEAGSPSDVHTIVLEAGGTLTGLVVDADKRPVPGATVRVVGKVRWGGGEGRTRDDGSFTIEAVRPGEHRVVAQEGWSNEMRAPGTTDDDVQGVPVQVRAGETTEVQLVVEQQFGTIKGRVVDADGAPVDDAFVQSTRESDSAAANANSARASVRWSSWTREPSLTEQDGSFSIDRLELGTHTVMAMRKGGGEGVVEHVATGESGVVIRLESGGSIAGSVALSSGGAPRRFSITLEDRSQGLWRNEDFFETKGGFRFADLPAGKYTVGVSAAEGSADTTVELSAGADRSGVALVLTPKVDVTGTIVDVATGEPVPGMKVAIAARKSGMFSFSFESGGGQEDVSDESGRFKVTAAPAGAVRISVMPRNFMTSDEEHYGWQNISRTIPADQPSVDVGSLPLAKSRAKRGDRGGDFGITLKEGAPDAEDDEVPLEIAVIRPGSPAANSELKVGDVLVEVDGQDVRGSNKYLYEGLTHVRPGQKVTFGTDRGAKVTLVAGKPI